MITLITGAPGAGKSAALVSLLFELSKERQIYVNGIPDLKIPHLPLDNPASWPDTVPDGSIIVIDEVQNAWRPRGPGTKVPPDVQALETHRHRGLDFYIITQGPNLVDTNVRALVGRHIHLRDVGVLGRWWYEWPECADNCRTGWKNAPLKKRYKLPKKAFELYKSSSLHIKPIRSFPVILIVFAIAVIALPIGIYMVYSSVQAKIDRAAPPSSNTSPKPTDSTGAVQSVKLRGPSRPAPDTDNPLAAIPQIDDLILTGHIYHPDGTLLFQWVPGGVPRYAFTRRQLAGFGITLTVDGLCRATITDSSGRSRKLACMPGIPVQQPNKEKEGQPTDRVAAL